MGLTIAEYPSSVLTGAPFQFIIIKKRGGGSWFVLLFLISGSVWQKVTLKNPFFTKLFLLIVQDCKRREEVELGLVAGACHPSTEEAEAGGFCEFEDNLNYRIRLFLKKSNYETRKKEGGKREGKTKWERG